MKILILLYALFIGITTNAQRVKYYLDTDGNQVEEKERNDIINKRKGIYSSWDYITKDSGRVSRLTNRYQTGILKREKIQNYLESLSQEKYTDSTIFFIAFNYTNDLCSTLPYKRLSKGTILKRKSFISPKKRFIEKSYKNVVYLEFFESGFTLDNKPSSKNEYFHLDAGDILKKLIFIQPNNCGSKAIIKPNGQTLVHNGESDATVIVQLLEDRNWNLFFPKE